jgi:hypothetical protein
MPSELTAGERFPGCNRRLRRNPGDRNGDEGMTGYRRQETSALPPNAIVRSTAWLTTPLATTQSRAAVLVAETGARPRGVRNHRSA